LGSEGLGSSPSLVTKMLLGRQEGYSVLGDSTLVKSAANKPKHTFSDVSLEKYDVKRGRQGCYEK